MVVIFYLLRRGLGEHLSKAPLQEVARGQGNYGLFSIYILQGIRRNAAFYLLKGLNT